MSWYGTLSWHEFHPCKKNLLSKPAQLSGLPAHPAVGAPATQMERSVRKKCSNQQYRYGTQIYTGATDYLCLWITKSCTPTQNKIETCLSRVLDIRHLYSWIWTEPWKILGRLCYPAQPDHLCQIKPLKEANQKRHTVCWNLCFRQQKHHHKLIKVSEKYV